MERTVLRVDEVSELTGVPMATLRYWRHRGIGPTSYTLGPRRVVYDRAVVEAWIDEQRRSSGGGGSAA